MAAQIHIKMSKATRDTIVASLRREARVQASCAEDKRAQPSVRAMSAAAAMQLHEIIRQLSMADSVEFSDG